MNKNEWDKIAQREREMEIIKSLSTEQLKERIDILEKLLEEIKMRLDTLT